MTEQEAIERIKIMGDHCGFEDDCVDYECEKCSMAREAAISALEELQQYRALGTVEQLKDMKKNYTAALSDWRQYRKIGTVQELREAMERRVPKKAHKYIAFDGITRNGCPNCFEQNGRNEILYAGQKYCSVCGQAIDWSDTE